METKPYLKSMKSRYFMLVACLTLILGTTACSNEDFGTDFPEQEKVYTKHGKTYTKQELIEMALSRSTPMTKAGRDFIEMVSIGETVTITCNVYSNMRIIWNDGIEETIQEGFGEYTHTYSDDFPARTIQITGSANSIDILEIQNNELISLNIDAPTLWYLDCNGNHLDDLFLHDCYDLVTINAEDNELYSIEITKCPNLTSLRLNNNRLKNIELFDLKKLSTLELGGSKITDLDLTQNTELSYLVFYDLPLKTINNQAINDTSFSCFPYLLTLDIAGTPFTSLDVSANMHLQSLNIAHSDIEKLTIPMTNLGNLRELRIEKAPFEHNWTEIEPFIDVLRDWSKPDDYGIMREGHLYTYASHLHSSGIIQKLKAKNWTVHP